MPAGVQTMGGLPLALFIKGLDDVLLTGVTSVQSIADRILEVESTKLIQNKEYSMAGLEDPGDWNMDGDNMNSSTMNPRYETTVTQAGYALQYLITWKMQYYDLHKIVTKGIKDLGVKMKLKRESKAASLLSSGFTTYWNTTAAAYLFSASHSLDSRSLTTTTFSNLASGGLSVSTLKDAILLIEETPDDMGKMMRLRPRRLIVPPALKATAQQVLGQGIMYEAQGNDFNKNLFTQYDLELVVWPELQDTSSTAWFLQADQHGLGMKESQTIAQDNYEYPNKTIGHRTWGALQTFVRDPRGIVGSLGT
jgi:hypothetical protein